MGARVSLKDVAARAEVSVTTASRVLSGVQRNVDPELAERVRVACEVLGYKVNAAARALRVQSMDAIALVVPAVANAYFAELVSAYSRRLGHLGKRLVTIDTDESPEIEQRQLAGMDRVLVDAVLIVPAAYERSGAAIAELSRSGRVVQVDRRARGVEAPSVRLDNTAGVRILVDHLRSRGRRRILMVDAQEDSSSSIERTSAFRALAGPGDRVLEMPSFTVASGIEAAKRLLADPHEPDAIICTADVVALGLLTALQHAGKRVPDDYAIATFDGTFVSATAAPGLTTLGSVAEGMVEASLTLLEGGGGDVVLTPELVIRGSSG
ncbi:LacI family transcriptional regulator [Streptomyces sp. NBC_00669]|uniref:LacI family DNA-binding transcriptional regulator n=1 Tax=Streptomyces sp. NBC_00669 TaxID=2976011 RepID=UPI002E36EC05|nr:LacI family DNA-binding transcriptional regulator [Streptomyces sp. NBC_00669]